MRTCRSFALNMDITTYYCTNCWKTIEHEQRICPHCHAEQERLDAERFSQKLIRALHHPEPETPIRAAKILGWLRVQEAVPELVHLLRESPDPYIAAACADALGSIGSAAAIEELRKAMFLEHAIIVRRAAEESLKQWKGAQ
jgi:HEAT repeat protein